MGPSSPMCERCITGICPQGAFVWQDFASGMAYETARTVEGPSGIRPALRAEAA